MLKRKITKNCSLVLLALIFFISLSAHAFAIEALKLPNPAATISMDFKDADLKDILKLFSMQSGMNFVASQAVQDRRVTLYLDKVPVMDVMNKLFQANNLSYEKEPSSNIIIVTDWGAPRVQTITKAFVLKYNRLSNSRIEKEISNYLDSASEFTSTAGTAGGGGGGGGGTAATGEEGLTESIKKILTENGKITEDIRSNSLVVTDIPSNFPTIEATIAALDVAVPQIMLEVEMLDVSKSKADQIGFKYSQTPFTAVIKGASADLGYPFHSFQKVFNKGSGSIDINGTDETAYRVQFDFLKTDTDSKYLARPRILTLSNETAEIMIATDESIGVTTTTSASSDIVNSSAERSLTGVILRITPQVNMATGEITMFVMPSVAEAVQGNLIKAGGQVGNVTFRDPEVRSTKTVVRVKDGDTIVLGGLIRNKKQQVVTKLPFFGDIPLVGLLFKHKSITPNEERELIVFITPRIVKEGRQAQTFSEGSATKEIAAEFKKK